MTEPGLSEILSELEALQARVTAEAAQTLDRWRPMIRRAGFADSAANFAAYLALRQHDIRPLQRNLMRLGLSSLGRAESRVEASLEARSRPCCGRPWGRPSPARAGVPLLRGRRGDRPPRRGAVRSPCRRTARCG